MKKNRNLIVRFFSGLGGAIVGVIIGVISSMVFGDGLSIPPDNGDLILVVSSIIGFTIIGFIFYRIFGWICDILFSV